MTSTPSSTACWTAAVTSENVAPEAPETVEPEAPKEPIYATGPPLRVPADRVQLTFLDIRALKERSWIPRMEGQRP